MSKKKIGTKKETARKKTLSGIPEIGAPANEQDVQRRIGNFQGAGEPARKGGRKGIVGQTTKNFRTDNRGQK